MRKTKQLARAMLAHTLFWEKLNRRQRHNLTNVLVSLVILLSYFLSDTRGMSIQERKKGCLFLKLNGILYTLRWGLKPILILTMRRFVEDITSWMKGYEETAREHSNYGKVACMATISANIKINAGSL